MKKIFFLIFLLFPLQIFAQAETPLKCFAIENETVITGLYKAEGCNHRNLVIPERITEFRAILAAGEVDSVTFPSTMRVIGGFNNQNLTSVTIPDSVTEILPGAFSRNKIKELHLGKSVLLIGNNAFAENKIEKIVIPDVTLKIGDRAFIRNQLESVIIGNSVTDIGEFAFNSTRDSHEQPYYNPQDPKIEFNYPYNKISHLVLGNNIQTIGEHAFAGNKISNINISDSVKNIGKYAFFDNKIKTLHIGSGLTKINHGVFQNNEIENLTIPTNITEIGPRAFMTNKIKNINWHDNLGVIERRAFFNNQIENLSLPKSLKMVTFYAFRENNIKNLDLANAEYIHQYSFDNNYIQEVVIPPSLKAMTSGAFIRNPIKKITATKDFIIDAQETRTQDLNPSFSPRKPNGQLTDKVAPNDERWHNTENKTLSRMSGFGNLYCFDPESFDSVTKNILENPKNYKNPIGNLTGPRGKIRDKNVTIECIEKWVIPKWYEHLAKDQTNINKSTSNIVTNSVKLFPNFSPKKEQAVTNLRDSKLSQFNKILDTTTTDYEISRLKFLEFTLKASGINIDDYITQEDINNTKFSDISQNKTIAFAYKYKIISGYDDGSFRPTRNITSAEATKILVESLGIQVADKQTQFDDVDPNNTLGKYIQTAYNNYLLSGVSSTKFEPHRTIKKYELLKILYNILN